MLDLSLMLSYETLFLMVTPRIRTPPPDNPFDPLVGHIFLLRYGAVFLASIKDNPYRILLYGGTGRFPNTVRLLFVRHLLGVQAIHMWQFNSVHSVMSPSPVTLPRSFLDVR